MFISYRLGVKVSESLRIFGRSIQIPTEIDELFSDNLEAEVRLLEVVGEQPGGSTSGYFYQIQNEGYPLGVGEMARALRRLEFGGLIERANPCRLWGDYQLSEGGRIALNKTS